MSIIKQVEDALLEKSRNIDPYNTGNNREDQEFAYLEGSRLLIPLVVSQYEAYKFTVESLHKSGMISESSMREVLEMHEGLFTKFCKQLRR